MGRTDRRNRQRQIGSRAIFADLGVPRIDADAAAHSLTASDGIALPEIRRLFGDTVFDTQGLLRRDILRKEIFASPSRKALLESVMLPLISQKSKTARNLYRCGLRHCRNSAADGEASIYQPDTACPDHKRTFGKTYRQGNGTQRADAR
ncbi:dephospho-CoA kinase [Neisseria gonorrhoeae]|uniref:Dephospho-CoA kinase n=1 Tax=Neisseria gonorrhoeae TaxID=485 RepID=A0A378VWC6_NEIGO|nr:dephospho-CoA kinase [Neisseria gonorrhoeae]